MLSAAAADAAACKAKESSRRARLQISVCVCVSAMRVGRCTHGSTLATRAPGCIFRSQIISQRTLHIKRVHTGIAIDYCIFTAWAGRGAAVASARAHSD